VYLLHVKNEALEKFRIFKNEFELHCETSFKRLRSDRGGEYYDPKIFQSTGIIHEIRAPIHHNKMVWPKEKKEH